MPLMRRLPVTATVSPFAPPSGTRLESSAGEHRHRWALRLDIPVLRRPHVTTSRAGPPQTAGGLAPCLLPHLLGTFGALLVATHNCASWCPVASVVFVVASLYAETLFGRHRTTATPHRVRFTLLLAVAWCLSALGFITFVICCAQRVAHQPRDFLDQLNVSSSLFPAAQRRSSLPPSSSQQTRTSLDSIIASSSLPTKLHNRDTRLIYSKYSKNLSDTFQKPRLYHNRVKRHYQTVVNLDLVSNKTDYIPSNFRYDSNYAREKARWASVTRTAQSKPAISNSAAGSGAGASSAGVRLSETGRVDVDPTHTDPSGASATTASAATSDVLLFVPTTAAATTLQRGVVAVAASADDPTTTRRPHMPPAHQQFMETLTQGSLLLLVVCAIVVSAALGVFTCVAKRPTPATVHHPYGITAHQAAAAVASTQQQPRPSATAPMLSVVSGNTGAAAMERLRGGAPGGAPASLQVMVGAQRDRAVRLHSVRTDLQLDLPPRIALPDGEEHPYTATFKLRDHQQESEIYQKCIRPPPNRTVYESESPPPYRSSSAGLLSGSSTSSGSSDWSTTGVVVRCHSMSSGSTSKPSAVAATPPSTSKSDFLQRTVKIFTGKKFTTNPPASNNSVVSQQQQSVVVPCVVVPTARPRQVSSALPPQQQQVPQQQHTTLRPKPTV